MGLKRKRLHPIFLSRKILYSGYPILQMTKLGKEIPHYGIAIWGRLVPFIKQLIYKLLGWKILGHQVHISALKMFLTDEGSKSQSLST
jgi:hypothetical protein